MGDLFTKNTIEAEQFFKLWHTLCGYRSWSILEEISTKAAAIALMVQGSYVCVQDMKACNIYASACSVKLQLIGQPHGGYYDEDRVWHPRASPPSQVTYGLGVGATTIVGAGEAGATELAGVHPGQRVPGAKGTQGLLQVMRLQNEEARRSALSLSWRSSNTSAARCAVPCPSARLAGIGERWPDRAARGVVTACRVVDDSLT